MSLKEELGKLLFCFERGKLTYNEYLSNGSIYLYAKILKDNNEIIKSTIINSFHLMPGKQRNASLKLIHHIDVWLSLWQCLEGELKPLPYDKFVFENKVNYPSEAEKCLSQFYYELN